MVNVREKNIDILLEQVTPLYMDAVEGNQKAVQNLHQLLEQVRSDGLNNPLMEAYHGSTMTLIARDETKPLERLRWAEAGLNLLDGAVSAAPQDSIIRLMRGKAAYKLPEKYFHRSQTAIEDYTFLIDREMNGEGFLNTEKYLELIYELGEVYYRIGRNQAAAICWKRLMNETRDPNFLNQLKLKIKSLEGKPSVKHLRKTESLTSTLLRRIVIASGNVFETWAEEQKNKKE